MPPHNDPGCQLVVVGCPSIDDVHVGTHHRRGVGGAAFITALSARTAGLEVGLVARLPREIPDEIAAVFGPGGLKRPNLPRPRGDLPRFVIGYDQEQRAEYGSFEPGVERGICAADVPTNWLDQAALVHVAALGETAARQHGVIQGLREAGYTGLISAGTGLLLARREPEGCRNLAATCDLFFLNREEAGILFPQGVPRTLETTFVITDGARPVEVTGGPHQGTYVPPEVSAYEATGAGDAFCGGFLAGLIDGRSPPEVGFEQAARALAAPGAEALMKAVVQRVGVRAEPSPARIAAVAAELSRVASGSSLDFCGFPLPERDDPLAVETLALATLHQYGFWFADDQGWTEPMFAMADGKRFKGSDFIWQAFTRAARDPEQLDARRLATDPELFPRICQSDAGSCPVPQLESHVALQMAYGNALLEQWDGRFSNLLAQVNQAPNPGATLLEQLARLPGFAEDPLAKKANLLVVILANRPEGFLALRDPDCVQPIVDYHLMRGCLRTGCVSVLDEDLALRLARRQWVDGPEEEAIRAASNLAIAELVRQSGRTVGEIDGFFFVNGRRTCLETEEARCETCVLQAACAREKALFQPVIRTTAY